MIFLKAVPLLVLLFFAYFKIGIINPDYAIGFPMFTGRVEIARKSGCLEILAKHRDGEIDNSNEMADFEAISARNRRSIAYFEINDL